MFLLFSSRHFCLHVEKEGCWSAASYIHCRNLQWISWCWSPSFACLQVSFSSGALIPTEWFTVLSIAYIQPNPSELAHFQAPAETLSVNKCLVHHQATKRHLRKHNTFQLLLLFCTEMKNFQEWSATCAHADELEPNLFSILWTIDFRNKVLLWTSFHLLLALSCQGLTSTLKRSLSNGLVRRLYSGNSTVLMMRA